MKNTPQKKNGIVSISIKRSLKLKDREVIYVPLTIAKKIAPPFNMISIASSEDERPDLSDEGINCLKLYSPFSNEISDEQGRPAYIAITEFVERLNGASIIVHCYYGEVRSKRVAEQVAANFGYTVKQEFEYRSKFEENEVEHYRIR